MNFFQRLFVRAAAWIAPPLGKLLRSTGGTIERAQAEISELRERNNIRRQQIQDEQQELREAIQMIAPAWLPPVDRLTAATSESLRESGAPQAVIKCVERLWELELALEDRGWVRELTLANFEFSLFGIHRIIAICRLFHIKNPLIRRGIQVCSFYVFGRGVTISSDDDDTNQVLQDFFTSPKNIQEVGHCALVRKNEAMWTDGNLYVIFFRDQKTGELVIRSLDPIEIVEIVHDPDDASQEQFIHRRWMSQQFDVASGRHTPAPAEAWYPALGYDPDERPPTIGNVEVSWETPVDHVKVGAMANWQYGVPLAYPAIDYARAVRKLIDNWCSIQEAMARFSWQVETQGGLPAIANLKATLATTLATGDGSMFEQNPPPTAAAAWISGPGNKLSMSKTSGMIDSPEIGRRVAHLVYMIFGLPECYDAQTEVLTDHGFVLHSEWQPGWKVACFNPAGPIEWHAPKELRQFDYAGEMVHFNSAQVDILVTPNHRMWCAPVVGWDAKNPKVDRSWRIEEAAAIQSSQRVNGWRFSIKIEIVEEKSPKLTETPIGRKDAAEWARFLGYWISEGCATQSVCKSGEFRKDGTPIMRTFRRVMLAQKTPNVLQHMRDCLAALGIHFGESIANADVTDLVIHNKTLWEWLRENCGTGSHSKHFPPEYLNASRDVRQALYDALMEGDGHPSGGSMVYSTVSSVLADQMQLLACSLGLGASITTKSTGYKAGTLFCVWIRSRITDEAIIKPHHISRQDYDGKVYCFSVPTGIYVTRRNGKIAIQGNTFFADASVGTVATATSLDRPTELKFKEDQATWREIIQKWGGYAVESSKQSPTGRLSEAKTKSKPKSKTAPTINVVFPSILEHDIVQQIQAIVQAATLGGFECTGTDERLTMGLLMQELEVNNWKDVLELMYPEDEYKPLMDRTPLLAQQQDAALNPPPAPAMGGAPPNTGPTGTPTPNPAKPAPGAPPETPTGAPPQAPMPKKPHAKHMTGAESAQLARAVAGLERAAKLLKGNQAGNIDSQAFQVAGLERAAKLLKERAR